MKSSWLMPSVPHSALKRSTTWSASSFGWRPFACAARSIFWPCSSVPVRK
jgi:hypothetical protein